MELLFNELDGLWTKINIFFTSKKLIIVYEIYSNNNKATPGWQKPILLSIDSLLHILSTTPI